MIPFNLRYSLTQSRDLFFWIDSTSTRVISPIPPDSHEVDKVTQYTVLDTEHTVLTLTSEQAVTIGLATASVQDADSLGAVLRIHGWHRACHYGDVIAAYYRLFHDAFRLTGNRDWNIQKAAERGDHMAMHMMAMSHLTWTDPESGIAILVRTYVGRNGQNKGIVPFSYSASESNRMKKLRSTLFPRAVRAIREMEDQDPEAFVYRPDDSDALSEKDKAEWLKREKACRAAWGRLEAIVKTIRREFSGPTFDAFPSSTVTSIWQRRALTSIDADR